MLSGFIRSATLVFLLPCTLGRADTEVAWTYEPAQSNLEAREWFQDAKFGIFIHWGVYSELGGAGEEGIAEWVMERKKIPIDKYERLSQFFNPVGFDAEEWVLAFKSAGARYVTITSKHHDGFAMYDSKASDYDIVERTPFGRDVIAELKRSLRQARAQAVLLLFAARLAPPGLLSARDDRQCLHRASCER